MILYPLYILALRFLCRARSSSERLVWSPLVIACRENHPSPSRLMIVAHPDDESLFGGDALTSTPGWMVVCVTSAGVMERRTEFVRAMHYAKANFAMLDHADHLCSGNFHPALEQQLREILEERPWERIVTHGPHGEYGHPQHKAIHEMVRRLAPRDRLSVFGFAWWGRATVGAKKEELLAQYKSQDSIQKFRFLAAREQLRPLG